MTKLAPPPNWPSKTSAEIPSRIKYGGNKKAKKKILLNIATWNARTLIDRDDINRPHWHTALIASEHARYKIDIAALSETRLAGKRERERERERDDREEFFWIGRASDDKREERLHM